jgi:hypothetical protein
MQAEHKHTVLDQSSQPRTDPEASKQYSDSFPLISFKSQHLSHHDNVMYNSQVCESTLDHLDVVLRAFRVRIIVIVMQYGLITWNQGGRMENTAEMEVSLDR